jgi:outer membrane usher protein FimD/PapC
LSNIAYSRTGGKTYSGSSTSSSSTQVGIESGLFFADGAFGVSAPFNSSSGFVIAKVKGIENSVKFNDGQYKSGILGGAVLPTNKDSISKFYLDLTSLPDNVDIKQNSIVALGEYKRGGVAEISSESGLIIIGILKDQNGKAIDMVSGFAIQLTKTKEKEPIIFFTNSDGKFVMSGVAPGKYRVSVNIEGVDDFEIEIPNLSKKPIMDLGVMICHITDENTKEN